MQTIKCPKCDHEFELNQAFAEQFREKLTVEIEAQAKLKAEEPWRAKLELAEQDQKKMRGQVKEAQARELEALKKKQEYEAREQQLELEVQRMLNEERKKIVAQASSNEAEKHALKDREKDDHIKSLMKKIDELKRQAEVGSQERQGEALEGELIDVLRRQFPFDEFEEIKKGARGADILQKVRNDLGKTCGSILWETKNTKDFQKGWIDKLKKDQQAAGAELAVLMSIALPPEIDGFDLYQDVWVTNFASAISLCAALRQTLSRVERERSISQHQGTMKDVIYQYITGHEFTQRVKLIVGAYKQMHEDLESEKRSMNRIWNKREKQISTVLDNMTGMYGEIEGILGGHQALPGVDILSLHAIAEDDGED